MTVWGSGTPKREFLYVDDMAAACIHLMNLDKTIYEQHTEAMRSHINVGCGNEITIRQLAEMVAAVVGYSGLIHFDQSKPDGSPRKLMDCRRMSALGWQPKVGLEEGLTLAYADFFKAHCGDKAYPSPLKNYANLLEYIARLETLTPWPPSSECGMFNKNKQHRTSCDDTVY